MFDQQPFDTFQLPVPVHKQWTKFILFLEDFPRLSDPLDAIPMDIDCESKRAGSKVGPLEVEDLLKYDNARGICKSK